PMSSPACRPGLPAPRRQATLLPRPAAPLSASKRAVHRTRPAHSTFEFSSSPGRRRRARVISSCHGGMVERRRLLLIPAISLTIGSLQYSLEKGAAKAEFTDSEFSVNILPSENRQVFLYYNTSFEVSTY
uniref:Uncharacterized protein n=1 Tax=Aegilops tauschii subsp. strangulata TaxID=200361 RepID=A0A453AE37_AEGTS